MLSGSNVCANVCPSGFYVGFDMLKTSFSTKAGYGSNVFAKNPTAFNAFVGYKLPRNFFVEAGYKWTVKKGRTARITDQDTFLGVQDMFDEVLAITQSKIKRQLPYVGVGINYEIPQFTDTSVFALAGISALKVKTSYEVVSDIVNGTLAQAVVDVSRRTLKKNKIIPLIKLGVEHKFTEHFGLRFTGSWYKFNNVKLDKTIENPEDELSIRFRDSYSVGLGLFYSL